MFFYSFRCLREVVFIQSSRVFGEAKNERGASHAQPDVPGDAQVRERAISSRRRDSSDRVGRLRQARSQGLHGPRPDHSRRLRSQQQHCRRLVQALSRLVHNHRLFHARLGHRCRCRSNGRIGRERVQLVLTKIGQIIGK